MTRNGEVRPNHAQLVSSQTELENALDDWERLAKAEGDAIRQHDWTALAACQKAIRELQPRINSSLHQVRGSDLTRTAAPPFPEERVRTRAAQLITVAQQNLKLLQQAREATRVQYDKSQRSRRTLRRLRTSYSPLPPAAWTSFS